jgi:PAS domain S-box-containing protein
MEPDLNEEQLLRSVALQNARAILLSRERAERELRVAQQELRDSNERIKSILESIADGFLTLDRQWRLTYLNAKSEQLLRRVSKTQEILLGRSLWEEFPDLVGTSIEENYRRAVKERVPVEFQTFYSPLNAWFDVRAYPSPEGLSVYFHDITERMRAEEALRQQHEWLRVTLSSIGDAVIATDTEGRVTYLNPTAESITGWSASKASGRRVEEVFTIVNEKTGEPAPDPLSKALHEGVMVGLAADTVLVAQDGTLRAIEDSAAPIKDASGNITGAVMVFRDVTERRKSEEVRFRLAAVVESSDDAILSMSLDAIVTTWNKGAQEMFGYAPEEIIGRSVTLLIPPERENEEPQILARIVRGERVDHYETVRMHKDGKRLHVSLSVSPIHDAEGRIVGVSKISRDMTARKAVEERLQNETRDLELLNSIGTAIASKLELQALVQTATNAATQLTGAKYGAFLFHPLHERRDDLLTQTLSESSAAAFESFGLPRDARIIQRTFGGEKVVRSVDLTKDAQDGVTDTQSPLRSYLAVPVVSRSGEVIGGLFFGHPAPDIFTERAERLALGVAAQAGVAIDNARLYDAAQREISERARVEQQLRNAQEALSRHTEDLEKQVEQRTASLRETIGELEAFSYSISHDLRAPLRAMHGYADALLEDYRSSLDDEAVHYLERIQRGASRLDLLVQDVLAYSKVAKGKVHLDEIDLEHLIREVAQNYPQLAAAKLDLQIRGPLPKVLGHEAYLVQSVANLLGNAIKFVRSDVRPKVIVYAEPDGPLARIWFEDNGIGIPAEHYSSIFQIFGRVHPEKKYEGTGIGLAVVKKAIERLGGKVGVTSELGKGSRFWIALKPVT